VTEDDPARASNLSSSRVPIAIALIALVVSAVALGVSTANRTAYPSSGSEPKVFVVFVQEQNFSQSEIGIPNYTFVPDSIVVNQGDSVTIHFYNTDINKHTFTIGPPYNVNLDLAGGENQNVTFVASHAGVFTFYCIYHLPTMVGQLTVLPT
jgi:plastocyanin